MIEYKNILVKVLILFILIFFLIISMNYQVDPYGYNSRDKKFIKNLTMFNKPNVTNSRLSSDGYYYLIGSSRMARVDPKLIEALTNKKTHNIKIDGATLTENTMLAEKVKEKGSNFIYSFDAFSLNKNRQNFSEISDRADAFQKELDKNLIISKYFNSDITIRSLQHIIKHLNNEKINKQYLSENSRESFISKNLAKLDSGISNKLFKANFSNFDMYPKSQIINLANLAKSNDIFIIFPQHIIYYSLFSEYQDIERQYFSAINTLVNNTKGQVWSFYGINDISIDKNNFIDNGWHFKPYISNIIFNQVFNSNSGQIQSNIGMQINRDNLSRYLNLIKQEIIEQQNK
jgi:hypothetical protein